METLPDLSRLSHEQKDDIIRMLFEKLQQLTARVAKLEARLSVSCWISDGDRFCAEVMSNVQICAPIWFPLLPNTSNELR